MIYGTASGQTPNYLDIILLNERLIDFFNGILILSDNDSIFVLSNHKIFLTIIKAIKNILFHSQVKCCVGRRGFKKNHNSTSVLFCMIY